MCSFEYLISLSSKRVEFTIHPFKQGNNQTWCEIDDGGGPQLKEDDPFRLLWEKCPRKWSQWIWYKDILPLTWSQVVCRLLRFLWIILGTEYTHTLNDVPFWIVNRKSYNSFRCPSFFTHCIVITCMIRSCHV